MDKVEKIYKEVLSFCEKRGLIKKLEESFLIPESERFKQLNVSKEGLDVLDAVHCVYDKSRTKFFLDSIRQNISKGDVVLEAGIGTGILSFCAASRGAKVYGCEINPEVFKLANAIRIHLEKKNLIPLGSVKFFLNDATVFVPSEKVDVIISENIYTGMFFEYQVQIMNHLIKFLNKGGICIPQKLSSFISFSETVFPRKPKHKELFIPSQEKKEKISYKLLSDPYRYDEIDFTKVSDTSVRYSKSNSLKRGGLFNSFLIYSEVVMPDGCVIGKDDTTFLNNEIIIAVDPPIKFEKGDKVRLDIEYPHGGKPDDLSLSVKKVN
jgi:predicted RNA methylase